jgi:hypothetical protein
VLHKFPNIEFPQPSRLPFPRVVMHLYRSTSTFCNDIDTSIIYSVFFVVGFDSCSRVLLDKHALGARATQCAREKYYCFAGLATLRRRLFTFPYLQLQGCNGAAATTFVATLPFCSICATLGAQLCPIPAVGSQLIPEAFNPACVGVR